MGGILNSPHQIHITHTRARAYGNPPEKLASSDGDLISQKAKIEQVFDRTGVRMHDDAPEQAFDLPLGGLKRPNLQELAPPGRHA